MVLGNNDRGQSECQRDKLKEEMSWSLTISLIPYKHMTISLKAVGMKYTWEKERFEWRKCGGENQRDRIRQLTPGSEY